MSTRPIYSLKRGLGAAICFVIHVGLWFLFVDKSSAGEWVLGLASATLATIGVVVFYCCADIRFRPTIPMILEGWRLPGYVISGSWEIFKALAKQLATAKGADSHLAAIPYESCEDNPRAAARRTLEVTYSASTPNFVIVGIVREQGLLLFHQILKGDIRQMTQNLGAKVPEKSEGAT
jgi:hypothetical protein